MAQQAISDRGGPHPANLTFFEAPAPQTRAARAPFAPRAGTVHVAGGDYRHVWMSDADYEKSVVKSAHRVLMVFEYFAERRGPASAIEIAASLSLPQSSTSMLLRSLVSIGYLGFDATTRLYAPTLRLSLLGGWDRARSGLATELIDLLAEFHQETGECVLVAEQYRHFIRVVHVLQSADPAKVQYVPIGTLRPICTTAFGHMLLAYKTEREARRLLHGARADAGSTDYGFDMETVIAAVREAGRLGFACTSREVDGFRTYQVAVLLPTPGGGPAMAVGISSYGDRFLHRKEMLLERLFALVERLEASHS